MQTIEPVSPLPAITNPVLIDGWSQPSYAGAPLIDLDGSQAGGGDGLTITGPDVTVRGLDIGGFGQGAGFHITGTSATGDWIYGDFLGTDPTGTQARPNNYGVEIDGGAAENLIGTDGDGVNDAAERNLISGNDLAGIQISGQGTDGNAIAGNLIGTSVSGDVALDNGSSYVYYSEPAHFNGGGIVIQGGASENRIGTDGKSVDDVGERNVILDLVEIWGPGTDENIIAGNFIGTDATGTKALGTESIGVLLDTGASSTWVGVNPNGGAALDDEGNVVPGGVWMDESDDNVVAGDKIGTDVTGEVALGIAYRGVSIWSSSGNTIGGTVAGAGDIISGCISDGIQIQSGSNDNLIEGDKIGTDITGTVALDNVVNGVEVDAGCTDNTIGGTASGSGNVISGNGEYGIRITGDGATGNLIQGSKIGTDSTGELALGNGYNGVEIDSGSGNTIGGTIAGAANVISGNGTSDTSNGDWGIGLEGSSDNLVEGNFIGTDPTGTKALGNEGGGVYIATLPTFPGGPSLGNTIGGTSAIAGNLIADNGGPGVVVGSTPFDGSTGNQITANRIFANTGQAIDLGDDGVTDNSYMPRYGPNNLQNFPDIVATAGGQLEGWIGGSLPDTTFRIDLFASAGDNPDGSGEAQDFLGSLEVTTNSQGEAVFDVPYSPPPGLPIITATATDPQGNTSDVSALQAGLELPPPSLRVVPDHALIFSTTSGDGIAIQDPDTGPLDPTWDLTLSVGAGTLTLPATAGLTGTGNGTGSLSYSGPLTALDAALEDMTFNPPAGPYVPTALTLDADSYGAPPLQAQFALSDGVFVVTTTADSGPGSLRQAILDSNALPGATNTIDFDIAGSGVQTIVPLSPLPPITASVLIDGTTQPGFAGTPLISFGGQSPASSSPLVISGGNVTLRGLAIDDVTIDATADESLIAVVAAPGATSELSLLGAQGDVLVQSDGAASGNPDDAIDEHLTAGDYALALGTGGGPRAATWTTMLMPSSSPFLPIPAGSDPVAAVAGDFTGDGHLDLAVADSGSNTVSVLLGNGDGTFLPAVTYAVGSEPFAIAGGDFTGDGRQDLVVSDGDGIQMLLGNGDGTFQPATTVAAGIEGALAAGDFTGDGQLDLVVAGQGVAILLGNGDGTFQPARTIAAGIAGQIVAGDFTGDGHLDLAVAGSEYDPVTGNSVTAVWVLLGNGDGTFQPARTIAAGIAGQIVAGDFTGDGHLDLAVAGGEYDPVTGNSLTAVWVLLGNGDGTFQPAVAYLVTSTSLAIVAGDFAGDGRIDLAVAGLTYNQVTFTDVGEVWVLLGNGDGTFQPAVTYPLGTVLDDIVAGDFTGDGRLDLAVVDQGTEDSSPPGTDPGGVSVLLGDGDGTFRLQQEAPNVVGSVPDAVAAGDFTGDGRLDLAVANYLSNDVSILLGNGDGTFQPALDLLHGSGPGRHRGG